MMMRLEEKQAPARLARQVQRARMLHYEATNSHNYTWIAKLRPDFDMFRARERKRTSSRLEMLATNRLTDISSYELPRDNREIHSYVRLYEINICGMQIRSPEKDFFYNVLNL